MTSSPHKCPKCGGEMEKGRHLATYTEITLAKKGQYIGDYIAPLLCKNCGYIELYKE